MRLILASGSPRRRELIAALGIPFAVIKPDINEDPHPGEANLAYVRRLSQEKAAAVLARLAVDTPAAVLAADTIVVLAADTIGDLDGDLLGKPADADEARHMLRRLRRRAHIVCTTFTLHTTSGSRVTESVQTRVHMRDYDDAEIEAYIATGDPFDKAGSYAIQHAGFRPVAAVEGCPNNVVGLPLCAVRRGLAQLGWPGITAADGCDCR